MQSLRTVITLLMLAIWPVASIHCKLESLPCLSFLECVGEKDGTKNCREDGCRTVEEAAYKSPDRQVVVPSAPVVPDLAGPCASELTLDPSPTEAQVLGTEPVLSLKQWPFSFRVSGSPRAPSVLA